MAQRQLGADLCKGLPKTDATGRIEGLTLQDKVGIKGKKNPHYLRIDTAGHRRDLTYRSNKELKCIMGGEPRINSRE